MNTDTLHMMQDYSNSWPDHQKAFQAVLVSATLTPSVERLAYFVLNKHASWIHEDIDDRKTSKVDQSIIRSREIDENHSEHNEKKGDEESNFELRGALMRTLTAPLTVPNNLRQFYAEISLKTRMVTLLSLVLEKGASGKVRIWIKQLY